MPKREIGLEDAYGLETPDDSVRLYRDWAETYDSSFAERMSYRLPQIVADAFKAEAGPEDGPVLDVGAGTGLAAEHLAGHVVDALDISPEMLAVASRKGLYRDTIVGDLTATLPIADASYGGLVSSGTFTHGHVGPEALAELLRIARPGALFVVSINAEVFAEHGFAAALAALGDRITGLGHDEVQFYGEDADPEHRHDTTQLTRFRKAG